MLCPWDVPGVPDPAWLPDPCFRSNKGIGIIDAKISIRDTPHLNVTVMTPISIKHKQRASKLTDFPQKLLDVTGCVSLSSKMNQC